MAFIAVGCHDDDGTDNTPDANLDGNLYSGYLMVKFATPTFISNLQSIITPDELYYDGGLHNGLEDESHVTLAHKLNRNTSLGLLQSYLMPLSAYTATLTSVIMFDNAADYDVLVAEVESEQFMTTNNLIMQNVDNGQNFSYIPHMTIAYLKKGCAQKYLSTQPTAPIEMSPQTFFYSITDENGQRQTTYF